MREETRQSFELAHHHNLWKSKGQLRGEDIVQCLAEAIKQHGYVCNALSLEAFDNCSSDIELIVVALHAYKEGNLGLSSKTQEHMSLDQLFHSTANKINLRNNK